MIYDLCSVMRLIQEELRSSPKAGFLKLLGPELWFVSAMVMEILARFSSKACLFVFFILAISVFMEMGLV